MADIILTNGMQMNQGSPSYTPGTSTISLPAGWYTGGTVAGDPNLVSANILSGKSIFGIAGSVIAGAQYATGTATAGTTGSTFTNSSGSANTYTAYQLTVSGLSFTPSRIIIYGGRYANGNCDITVYVGGVNLSANGMSPIYNTGSSGGNQFNGYYELVSPINVTSTGFTLPVYTSGGSYSWEAWGN